MQTRNGERSDTRHGSGNRRGCSTRACVANETHAARRTGISTGAGTDATGAGTGPDLDERYGVSGGPESFLNVVVFTSRTIGVRGGSLVDSLKSSSQLYSRLGAP